MKWLKEKRVHVCWGKGKYTLFTAFSYKFRKIKRG